MQSTFKHSKVQGEERRYGGSSRHGMSDPIIGKNPMRIEDMFHVLYRGGFYRGGPILSSAISGIEQAQ